MRRFFVPKRGGVSERGKIMMNINMLHVFSDLNGKIVYWPYDKFEKHAKTDESDFVRFTR
jgi:hypothetical protein